MAVGKRIATDLSEDVILHVAKAQRDVAVHLTDCHSDAEFEKPPSGCPDYSGFGTDIHNASRVHAQQVYDYYGGNLVCYNSET